MKCKWGLFYRQLQELAIWRLFIFSALSGCLYLVPALTSCWPGLNKVEKMWRDGEIHHLARTVLINKVVDSCTLTPCLLRYQFYTGEKIGKSFQFLFSFFFLLFSFFFLLFFFFLFSVFFFSFFSFFFFFPFSFFFLFSFSDKELQLLPFQAVLICAGNYGVHTCLLIHPPPPGNKGSSSTSLHISHTGISLQFSIERD